MSVKESKVVIKKQTNEIKETNHYFLYFVFPVFLF